MTYYTILTNVGKAKFANATALGTTVSLTQIAVGDGNGSEVTPTEAMTSLVNQVWIGNISDLRVDAEQSNWIIAEGYIASSVGGFMVREVGLFDSEGNLIAVGNYPDSYKPALESGAAKDMLLRIVIEVSNASSVTLTIDPAVILATREYVQGYAKKAWKFINTAVNYTASADNFVYADTSTASFTITLPATPLANDVVAIMDNTSSFATNPLTVARNGNNIMGLAEDMVVDVANISFELIYNGTEWRLR